MGMAEKSRESMLKNRLAEPCACDERAWKREFEEEVDKLREQLRKQQQSFRFRVGQKGTMMKGRQSKGSAHELNEERVCLSICQNRMESKQ